MDSKAAAFLDLLVDQNDRRIDEKPGIRRPSLTVIENYFASEAAANPALVGWQTFQPHNDIQADAMEGMCRGQSHRRNMAGRGAPAVNAFISTPIATALPRSVPLSQRPTQPARLRVAAGEKPRARRTAYQPLYVAKSASKPSTRLTTAEPISDGLMSSKWAQQPSSVGNGLAKDLTQWSPKHQTLSNHRPKADIAATVVEVTKMKATAPTVFRERPKRPPARSVPESSTTVAPSANIGPTVAATAVAPVKAAAANVTVAKSTPTKVDSAPFAPSSNLKVVGAIKILSGGNGDGSIYVNRYLVEATFEMLKENAIKLEDNQTDQEIWCIDGGI